MKPTEFQIPTETKLKRIAWLSSRDPQKEFNNLMHHFNKESLTTCFNQLGRKKAVGADRVNKDEYGKNLNENLENLIENMKRMAYVPAPVLEVIIPKEGKAGSTRQLGISNFEDKIVQKMFQKVLESIYEPIFLDCSYGFRPRLGCHDAIRSLHKYLYRENVRKIIDIDIANFFGTIDHKIIEEMIKVKIQDKCFIRYLNRILKAGVLSQGDLTVSDEGVPQGSICSPIMANIFAHYVLDEWFEKVVKQHCTGKAELFRYADDAVICCANEYDAARIMKVLPKRFAKYGLRLNEDKTRMVSFSGRGARQGVKQESFDFLGFTFYRGRSRKGYAVPKVKTIGKRLRAKLVNVKKWAISVKNKLKMKEIWKKFCSKLRGHIQYYGVSFNLARVKKFSHAAIRILFKFLNRRSQRKSFDWDQFKLFLERFPPPKVRVCFSLI